VVRRVVVIRKSEDGGRVEDKMQKVPPSVGEVEQVVLREREPRERALLLLKASASSLNSLLKERGTCSSASLHSKICPSHTFFSFQSTAKLTLSSSPTPAPVKIQSAPDQFLLTSVPALPRLRPLNEAFVEGGRSGW